MSTSQSKTIGSQNLSFLQDASGRLIVVSGGTSVPELKGSIFNTVVAANTNFFAADLAPTNTPTTFRIVVSVDANGVLNLMRTAGGVTVTEHLNENVNMVADCLYEFEFMVVAGQTINFQHTIGGTILSCIVTEVYK